jgi:hydroxyacylglutathione hydrolase
MIEKISDRIWKYRSDGNIYFLDLGKKIIIDTGNRKYRQDIRLMLSKVADFSKVEILTHFHYDHAGNFDIFPNAEIYASKEELNDFLENPFAAVLNDDLAKRLKSAKISAASDNIAGLKIIKTPGHTRGSICIWLESEKILFSGDTMFFRKNIGRTDLPTSAPDNMQESLIKLISYPYKMLCPGHDY